MAFAPKRKEIEDFLGPRALRPWVDALVKLAPMLCEHYNFSRLQWVHFIGQIAAETDGMSLKNLTENMYFTSPARIIEVYSYRLGKALKTPQYAHFKTREALARYLVRKPVELARVVYSNREGTPPGMGHKYIGRGPTQITHLNNYLAVGEEIARQPGGAKYDLVKNPELLATDPELGIRSAFADWKIKGLAIPAEEDLVDVVSDILNTGNANDNVKPHNLAGRRRWVAKAKVVWPASSGESLPKIDDPIVMVISGVRINRMLRKGCEGDDVKVLQTRLRDLGYFTGLIDGKFGILTERAVRVFQSEHALEDDGVVGPKTAEALNSSAPAELGERETITAKDLKKRGSRTVALTQRIKRLIEWVLGGTVGTAVDTVTGFGLVENIVSTGERIKSVTVRSVELVAGDNSTVVLTVLGIAAACGVLWWAFDRIEKYRVEDAQRGAHLGK